MYIILTFIPDNFLKYDIMEAQYLKILSFTVAPVRHKICVLYVEQIYE
jgi:hypothetical protein